MNTRTVLACFGAISCMSIAGCDERANQSTTNTTAHPTPSEASAPVAPDNTGSNAGDGAGAPTPLDQSQAQADIKVTADIRRAIMEDASMSVNAQNCKIITAGGVVTLRGVVDSQREKDAIEALARQFAGSAATIDNQLEVKTP